jgi:predicted nucleic acid-binding protein
MNGEVWYLDSSALVKTVLVEPESEALASWLEGKDRRASCVLARIEVARAVRISDPGAVARARSVIRGLTLIHLDDELLEQAALADPPSLRSLDAIHLAAALSVGDELAAMVTYDERLAGAAQEAGLTVVSPR